MKNIFAFNVVNAIAKKGEKLPFIGDQIYNKRMRVVRNRFENILAESGPEIVRK